MKFVRRKMITISAKCHGLYLIQLLKFQIRTQVLVSDQIPVLESRDKVRNWSKKVIEM